MRLCKDCKHFQDKGNWLARWLDNGDGFLMCGHPSVVDPVTGTAFVRCNNLRHYESQCGATARWFEPREPVCSS